MARRSKKDKQEAQILCWLAENLVILRDIHFGHLPDETARNKRLAKAADASLSTIQRVIKQEQAAGVDLVQRLALALAVRPHDLITPNFAERQAQQPLQGAAPQPGKPEHRIHEPETDSYLPADPSRSTTRKPES